MSLARVSVVIVNYNGAPFLPETLHSLTSQTLRPIELIVVDNASTDDSLAMVQEAWPKARLIRNPENRYFASGANQGVAASSGDYILLLNNDCRLSPSYLEKLAAQLEQDPAMGAAVGKIFRTDGETLDQAGQFVSRARTPRDRGYGEQDAGEYDVAGRVLSAGGVAPLMRRAMLDDVCERSGWFDEDFIQYYEDLDLFWRSHNLGWRTGYFPEAVAWHHRGGTGQSEKAAQAWTRKFAFANLPLNLQKCLLKNRHACMVKNDNAGSFLINLPFILYYELKALAYCLLVKPTLLGGWFASFRGLKPHFQKRSILKKRALERGTGQYGRIKL